MNIDAARWKEMCKAHATYYVWREYDNGEINFFKEVLSSDVDTAIASFVKTSENKTNVKSMLFDKTGKIIKMLPEDNELLGTYPFDDVTFNGPAHLKHLFPIDHAWHSINKQPYYISECNYANN